MAQWYRVGFIKTIERMFWFEYGQIMFYILRGFFQYLLRTAYGSLFSIKCFIYYLFHILILYLVLWMKTQCLKHTCILNIMLLSIIITNPFGFSFFF